MLSDDSEKRVTFAQDTKQGNAPFTPLMKPSLAAIRRKLTNFLKEGKYSESELYIAKCRGEGVNLNDFFIREGQAILYLALVGSLDEQILKFASKNFDADTIKTVLRQDNFYLLNHFLSSQSGVDEYNWTTDELIGMRIEKIKLLLALDADGFQACVAQGQLSEKLKIDISTAQQQYRAKILPH